MATFQQLLQTLNSGLQFGSQLLPKIGNTATSLGGLQMPNQLLGAGLLAGGVASDKEPGQVTEARQFLRNQFSSPNALADQFTGQVGALSQQFQPLLTQQRQRDIGEISQRFAAAFPSTVGAQGPEFGTLSRYITDEALPREQGLLGDLGLKLLDYQGNAAGKILDTNQQNPLSQLSSLLGYDLLTRGQGVPGGTSLMGQQGPGVGQVNPQLMSQLAQAVSAGSTGNLSQLVGLLSSGALRGMPFPFGVQASTPVGQLLQQAINAGLVESPAAQSLTGVGAAAGGGGTGAAAGGLDFGLPGAGLLGPSGFGSSGALLSSAGAALGGGAVGSLVGNALAKSFESHNIGQTSNAQTGAVGALGGAASGAAAGFAVGGPVGALIGAIAGGFGGGIFGLGAERRREAAQTAQETAQTNAQRPAALKTLADFTASSQQASQQFAAEREPVFNAVKTLMDAGDPDMRAWIAQVASQAPARTDLLRFLPSLQAGADMPQVRTFLDSALSMASAFKDVGNVESGFGLLQSTEIGKFGPGTEQLTGAVQRFQLGQQAYDQLKALLRQKGVL